MFGSLSVFFYSSHSDKIPQLTRPRPRTTSIKEMNVGDKERLYLVARLTNKLLPPRAGELQIQGRSNGETWAGKRQSFITPREWAGITRELGGHLFTLVTVWSCVLVAVVVFSFDGTAG